MNGLAEVQPVKALALFVLRAPVAKALRPKPYANFPIELREGIGWTRISNKRSQ